MRFRLLIGFLTLMGLVAGCAGITHEDDTRNRGLASEDFSAGEEFQWKNPESRDEKKARRNIPARYRYDDY